jgi:hypothetical protein
MNKRDRFVSQLEQEAEAKGLSFRVEKWRGKGGHAMVFAGDKLTTDSVQGHRSQDGKKDQETTWPH